MKIIFSDNSLRSLINFRGDCLIALNHDGHIIISITPKDEKYDMPETFGFVKSYVVPVDAQKTDPISDLGYMIALRRIYKKEKPNYIFHYTIKPNIYGTLAAKSLGIGSTAMVAGLGYMFSSNSLMHRAVQILYKLALKFTDNVLVLNQANNDLLVEKRIADPSKIILLKGGEGVNLTQFPELPMPNNTKPIFLMIARVLYDKGYSEFVAAAKKHHNEAEFRLIGSIDNNPAAVPESVIKEDHSNGYINYIGFTNGVISHLSQSDCMVLPSYHEGLSRSLMEGAACGRPLIASNISGCKETIDDGVNGYLVEVKSEQSLINVIGNFIALTSSSKIEMGKASRKKAEDEFDIVSVINLYRDILATNIK